MEFQITEVDRQKQWIQVQYGEVLITLRVFDTQDKDIYIKKPGGLYFNRPSWVQVIRMAKQAWGTNHED